jgi:hypothetical protein
VLLPAIEQWPDCDPGAVHAESMRWNLYLR